MSQNETKATSGRPRKSAPASKAPAAPAVEHVPVEAENFEHTLRRLVIEKEKARKGKFGLYR